MVLDGISSTGLINTGTINTYYEGIFAIDSDIAGDIGVASEGIITTTDGHGIELNFTSSTQNIVNDGLIDAGKNGMSLHRVMALGWYNTGTLTAKETGLAISKSYIANAISNSGTLTAGGVAIEVDAATVGAVENTGIISGGVNLVDSEQIAMDFRTASSGLELLNGSDTAQGVINGAIYGSDKDDRIELRFGALNGDVHEVETIDITGLSAFSHDIFSADNSSTLRIAEGGTLIVSTPGTINLQGDFVQDDTLAVVLNENTQSFDTPKVDATGSVTLNDGALLSLSVEDRNIANFNPGTGGGA